MIRFENISKEYSDQLLFQNVDLSIGERERCGIVGRNGSGKTTLLRLITGEEKPTTGNVFLAKKCSLGYLQQHIRFTHPTLVEEAVSALPPQRQTEEYLAKKILSGLGFSEEDFSRSPTIFSGGYQLRLHLAKVLLAEPRCLLLDEPTNYLDIVAIQWLQRFLRRWEGELLLISHDRAFMDAITTHTLGVYRQHVRKIPGSTEDFFTLMAQEEEVHERTRKKIEQKKADAENFIRRFGAKATKAAQARSRQKMIDKLPTLSKLCAFHNLTFSFPYQPLKAKKWVDAQNLHFRYLPNEPLIEGISLTIEPGDRIAIIGKNGRGKSTLLQLLMRYLTPQKGCVTHFPTLSIGYFGQKHIDSLDPSKTIEEIIQAANPSLSYGEVRNLCGSMLFTQDQAKKAIHVLSGGEKSRVVLGKILATTSQLLLLDEPTHHLDMESIEALMEAIDNFPGAIVLVSHSEEILHSFSANKIVICRREKQAFFLGSYADFVEKIGWEQETQKKRKPPSDISAQPSSSKKEIAQLEKEIDAIEKKIQQSQATLIQRLEEKNHDAYQNEAKHLQSLQEKRDRLFSAWENALLEK